MHPLSQVNLYPRLEKKSRDFHVAMQHSPIQRQKPGARPQRTGIYTRLDKQVEDLRIACLAVGNGSIPKSLRTVPDLTSCIEQHFDYVHKIRTDGIVQSRQTRCADNLRRIGACVEKELYYVGVSRYGCDV